MTNYLPSRDGFVRSMLRETIKRIRRVRERAGRTDDPEVVQTTGDPFRDLTFAFIRCVERVKENIKERNQGAAHHGQDRAVIEQSLAIHKDIRNLETILEEMKQEVNKSGVALEKATKKETKSQKVALLEKAHAVMSNQYKECLLTLDLVKESDHQRIAATSGVDVGQELLVGNKAQLRGELGSLRRPPKGEGGHIDPYAGADLEDDTVGGGRLEDHESTAEEMKAIAAQDKKIQNSLEVVSKGVARLHNLAVEIGGQIKMQNKHLDSTEKVMTNQADQLHTLNTRIKKLIKEMKPMNVCLYVCCTLLIMSLMSFFLMQFGVI